MNKPAPHDDTPERLRALQTAFAGHIRNPDATAAPADVEDRRMAIYRRLFFRNIRNFIAASFPVLRSLYSDHDWEALIREFYIEHRARTPLFPELPREFLRYIQEQRQDRAGDFPFMLELAHYEWVEVALRIEEAEIDDGDPDPSGDLLEASPVLSPVAWPLSYSFPVQMICKDFQPSEPPQEATHLLVYRRRDDKVRFMQINAVSRLLLDQLQAGGQAVEPPSGREMLRAVGRAIGREDPGDLVEVGAKLLADWREKDIVPGTRPASN